MTGEDIVHYVDMALACVSRSVSQSSREVSRTVKRKKKRQGTLPDCRRLRALFASILFCATSMSVFTRGHHTAVPHTFVEVPSPAGKHCAHCQCVLFTVLRFCVPSWISPFVVVAVRTSQECASRATSAPSAAQCCTRTATSSLHARSSAPAAAALPGARSGPRAACGASTSRSRATTTSHRPHRPRPPSLTTLRGRLRRSMHRPRCRACRRISCAAQTTAGVRLRRLSPCHRL